MASRFWLFLSIVAVYSISYSLQQMPGGASAPRDPDESEKELARQFQQEAEGKTNQQFSIFEPVKVRTQVVAGTNYFFKVIVGNGEAVHLRVFKPLYFTNKPAELALSCMKNANDPLEYFSRC